MNAPHVIRKNQKGFTLVELVIVVVLLGIVAVIAVPRLENLPNTRAYYAVRKLRSDVRFAQLLAIETQARTRIVFNIAADTYRLERETAPGNWTAVTNPATKGNYQEAFNTGDYAGVDVTQAVFDGNATVIFDSYGAPFDSANSPLAEPANVDLNSKYRLRFRAETGKVDIVVL